MCLIKINMNSYRGFILCKLSSCVLMVCYDLTSVWIHLCIFSQTHQSKSLVGMVFHPNRCVKWIRCVHKMDVRTKFKNGTSLEPYVTGTPKDRIQWIWTKINSLRFNWSHYCSSLFTCHQKTQQTKTKNN